jgi:hypothetical protein
VQLTPATFTCPTHHVDLTPQVVEALKEIPPPVAYGDRPFRVPVTCRGDGTAAAHALVCSGQYRR